MDRPRQRAASLAERTRARTEPAGGPGAPEGGSGPDPDDVGVPEGDAGPVPVPSAPQRHCWVVDGVRADSRAPGLLVEWRQLGGAWQGRVAYVVAVDGDPTLVEAWVPASQLRRATDA